MWNKNKKKYSSTNFFAEQQRRRGREPKKTKKEPKSVTLKSEAGRDKTQFVVEILLGWKAEKTPERWASATQQSTWCSLSLHRPARVALLCMLVVELVAVDLACVVVLLMVHIIWCAWWLSSASPWKRWQRSADWLPHAVVWWCWFWLQCAAKYTTLQPACILGVPKITVLHSSLSIWFDCVVHIYIYIVGWMQKYVQESRTQCKKPARCFQAVLLARHAVVRGMEGVASFLCSGGVVVTIWGIVAKAVYGTWPAHQNPKIVTRKY